MGDAYAGDRAGGVPREVGAGPSMRNMGAANLAAFQGLWIRFDSIGPPIPGSRRHLPNDELGLTCLLTVSYDHALWLERFSAVLASGMSITLYLYLRGCRSCNRFFYDYRVDDWR